MKRLCNIFFLLSIVAMSMHCSDNTSKEEKEVIVQKDELSGHWEVVNAIRDNKPTKLLNNTSFHFTNDSMSTNLPTQEGNAAYSWADNNIIRQSGDITTYTVHTLNNDSLEFSVELQGFHFDMTLIKVKQDSLE